LKRTLFFIVTFLIFLSAVTFPAFSQSFKAGTEPDGFMGLKWGAEASAVEGLKYVKDADIGGSYPVDIVDQDSNPLTTKVKVYLRAEDKLTYEGATLRSIKYGFCDGKLCEVVMAINSSDNWRALKEAVFPRFGEVPLVGDAPLAEASLENETEYYMWMGKISEMELIYNPSRRIGELWVGSAQIRERMFDEVRKKMKVVGPSAQPK
jgi:hypothetical protein